MSEFDLIARYFSSSPHLINHGQAQNTISLGVGDDAALLMPPPNKCVAVSSDMLIAGCHFFCDTDPYCLGYKSLAVNLSDLAAMGAQPWVFLLSLALPEVNHAWLAPFSEGLQACAKDHTCTLIGGDTTRGPLTISITVMGTLPPGKALRRDAAQAGDDIWISGTLGDAALGLAMLQTANHDRGTLDHHHPLIKHLLCPTPRLALGQACGGIAHAAIDISDGFVSDLSHLLRASCLGATVYIDDIPISTTLAKQAIPCQRQYALSGGDDYELCLTAPPSQREAIVDIARRTQTPLTRIGVIETKTGLRLLDKSGNRVTSCYQGFDHFA